MSKLTVEDTSLVSVANAIRTKGGTTDALIFPDGFVSAIDGIQSGGGGENYLPGVIDGSIRDITADMLDGCTKIPDYKFYYSNIISIVIPKGVTSIGYAAFNNCTSLTSIVIPQSVTSIGGYAFYYCTKLTSIVIPQRVNSIGSSTFYQCYSLTSIVIPQSVTSIGSSAFNFCTKITTIEMKPTTPPKIQNSTFSNCTALTTIKVPSASLNAYKSATNWSNYASKMVGV